MLYTLAIHPEDASWKIALLRFHEGKPQILCLKTIGLEENPLETLKTILHKKSYQIATAINAEDWVLRRLELEIKGWKNVLSALPFQAEDIIPFPKEQTVAIPFLEEETKASSKIRLIATKRDLLDAHIALMNKSGIDPHYVTTTVHALKRWLRFSHPQMPAAFLLYLHKENGFAAFLQNHEIVEFKTFSFDHLGQWQRVKDYFLSLSDPANTIPWITIGDSTLLEKGTFSSQDIEPSLLEYALPIGIALEATYNDKNSVQFRIGELKPLSLQKKEKKAARLSLLFLLVSFLLFGPLGYGLLYKHKQMLVPRAQKATEKLGLHSGDDDIENLLDALAARKSELEKEKKFGPYFPVVSWFLDQISLASHDIELPKLPQLTSLDYHLDSNGTPQLHIQWTGSNKESIRRIKRNLQETEGLRIAKWKETAQTYSIVLEKL